VTKSEDKGNIAIAAGGGLVTLGSLGVAAMRLTEHLACKSVAKQQEIMQAAWDQMHPDGFTPAGDQMRPISFDCHKQERPFKPLHPYTDSAKQY